MLGEYFSYEYWGYFILIMSFAYMFVLYSKSTDDLLYGSDIRITGWVLVCMTILYFGLRPVDKYGDSALYSTIFGLVQKGIWERLPGVQTEWLWSKIEMFFINNSTNQMWFLFIDTVYVGGIAYFCRKVFSYHFLTALLFSFTAMSFFTYGTNGLRQGFATSLAMIAFPLIVNPREGVDDKYQTPFRSIVAGATILLLSASIHRSNIALVAGVIAVCFLRNVKTNVIIWFCAIIVGFVLKDVFINLLSSVTGDFRLEYYSSEENYSIYGAARFRWDFILYSFVPIAIGYLMVIKYGIKDRFYIWLLNLYIIVNAGWVVINNISYSNRIAYISWILYPALLLYPFVKFDFSDNQGKILAIMLIVYAVFAYIML